LKDHPEFINDYPYEKGWMLRIKIANPGEIAALMDADAYLKYLQGR